MLAYLESHTPFPTTGRLFTFQSGSILTWGRLTSETRLLLAKGALNLSKFADNSFRIPTATTAALEATSYDIIEVMYNSDG